MCRVLFLLLGLAVVIPGIVAQRITAPGPVTPASWTMASRGYTWWIRPISAVYGGALYVGGIDRSGNYKIGKVATDGTFSEFTLATHEADDHNAPSITRLSNGKLLAMYTRHNQDSLIRYRISTNANDISAWEAVATLTASGPSSYTQAWVDSTGRVHLFYRVDAYQWAHRYSDDNAGTWSAEKIILASDPSYLYYIVTQPLASDPDTLRVASYGNPISSADHDIYFAEIDLSTGDMAVPGGASLVNLYDASAAADPTTLELVFDAGAGNTRLFDIGGAATPQILFATFANTLDAEYREARRTGGSWSVTTVVDAGSPIENPVGGNYYFAGMAATDDVDSIYVAREDASTRNWPLERYTNSGGWSVAETVMDGDWRHYAEIYRPMAPYKATVSFPVIALRGLYESYLGDYALDVVVDPAGEPAFSETVIHAEAFTGTAGVAISGWTVLSKSSGVTGETFQVADTENYFGGKYGRMLHSGGFAVNWGKDGSSEQDLILRVDMRTGITGGKVGAFVRWVDANNRLHAIIDHTNGNLILRERIAGVNSESTVALPGGLGIGDAVRLEVIANGTSATARLYQQGIEVAEVNRTLSATPAVGQFGLYSEDPTAPITNAATQVQKLLVTEP